MEATGRASARHFVSAQSTICKLVQNGDIEGVQRALQADSQLIHTRDVRSMPLLSIAIDEELPIMTRLLVESGADPIAECGVKAGALQGVTPLMQSLRSRRPYIAQVVVKQFLTNEFGRTSETFRSMREVEARFLTSGDKRKVRHVLIELYADTPLQELVYGVPVSFQQQPSRTLLDLLELASSTTLFAMRLKAIDPSRADGISQSSTRLQLLASGCLNAIGPIKDQLGRYECDELLRSPMGVQSLGMAIMADCRVYLTSYEVQNFFLRAWRGPMLNHLLQHRDKPIKFVTGLCCFALAFLVNVALLLPLAALFPPLETQART